MERISRAVFIFKFLDQMHCYSTLKMRSEESLPRLNKTLISRRASTMQLFVFPCVLWMSPTRPRCVLKERLNEGVSGMLTTADTGTSSAPDEWCGA